MPDNTCQVVDYHTETQISYDDEELARFAALFLAELAVDHFLPSPAYYLRPMDIAWAVDIIRRAAVECMEREIRRPKLYESLDFLEKAIDEKSAWLVRRYRRELRWDRRDYREKGRSSEPIASTGVTDVCM